MFEHMVDGVLVVDAQGVIRFANPAAHKLLVGDAHGLVGEDFGFPVTDGGSVVLDLFGSGTGMRTAEMRVAAIQWEGKKAHLLSLRDLTERVQLLRQLEHLVNYDTVTGLPTRVLLYEHLAQAIKEARRHGHTVALLFVDLDGFKRINDTLGHASGDALLRLVGQRLQATVREGDNVARLAGDEFTVTLTQVRAAADAEAVARKISQRLAQPYNLGNDSVCTSASIGIALFPQDADGPEELIKRADRAMYRAKALGKETYAFYSPA